jgi:hypothetical protein
MSQEIAAIARYWHKAKRQMERRALIQWRKRAKTRYLDAQPLPRGPSGKWLSDGDAQRSVVRFCKLRGCRPTEGDRPCSRCGTWQRFGSVKDQYGAMLKWTYSEDIKDSFMDPFLVWTVEKSTSRPGGRDLIIPVRYGDGP